MQVERDRTVEVDVALELELLADAAGQRLHGVRDGAVAERGRLEGVEVGGLLLDRDLQDRSASCWKSGLLATKSVSLFSSIIVPPAAATRPLAVVRSAACRRPSRP